MKKELMSGISVSKGVALGKVRLIKDESDIRKVEDGEILILPNSHPMYALAVMKAGGIICESGGKLSHICIVSLEMGIPCITQAKNVMASVSDGEKIILDANEGKVYIDEL